MYTIVTTIIVMMAMNAAGKVKPENPMFDTGVLLAIAFIVTQLKRGRS